MKINIKKNLCAISVVAACASSLAYGAGPIKVGDTEISVGGYIKADLIASDVDSSLGATTQFANQLVAPGFIPLEGDALGGRDKRDEVTLHARETRLTISTKTGAFSTRWEGDFFGTDGNDRFSNSNGFRTRIAWGQYGNWGFGQNWSAAVIFPSFSEQLNFSGFTGGYTALRQTGFRYSNGGFVLALENPETTLSTNEGPGIPSLQGTDSFPDVIARYGVKGGFGALQGALLFRELSDTSGENTDTGIGVILGGSLKLGSRDDLKFVIGNGAIGRYMADNMYADAEMVGGNLEALDVTSAQIAYRHFWSDKVRSTILYAASEADNDASFAGGVLNKEASTVMANLLWNTGPKTTLGIEVSKSEREVENGAKGELNRIQFSVKQKF